MPTVSVVMHGVGPSSPVGVIAFSSIILVEGEQRVVFDSAHVGRRTYLWAQLQARALTARDIDVHVVSRLRHGGGGPDIRGQRGPHERHQMAAGVDASARYSPVIFSESVQSASAGTPAALAAGSASWPLLLAQWPPVQRGLPFG